ncbi:hypothetical protein FOE78_08690 [Microlunatus elymi]|uniref:Septum formation initiator n=1 Tax=Microlunatus elymi TaxID=2596828 RepID=A0A516PXR7_9ACTN|nr:hypothetical protein [Microlunatus elymi]QDP95967.1 hypothetical protein FOE78_08690 [Microlunatus elymi]
MAAPRFPRTPRSRSLLTIGGWLVAASAATAVGALAVEAIGSGIAGTGAEPLSMAEIEQQLATAPAAASPIPSRTPSPGEGASSDVSQVIGTDGGTVLARCSDGLAELINWSPRQGYETDDVRRGPATVANIQFETDDLEINVRVSCVSGVPTGRVTRVHD